MDLFLTQFTSLVWLSLEGDYYKSSATGMGRSETYTNFGYFKNKQTNKNQHKKKPTIVIPNCWDKMILQDFIPLKETRYKMKC